MLTCSNQELAKKEGKLLRYIANEHLLKYLNDPNEIALLVNLYRMEMIILSLPVQIAGVFTFKRVLLIDEEGTDTMWLVYQESLMEIDVFAAFVRNKQLVKNVKLSLYELAIDIYLECLDGLQQTYEDIEAQVINAKSVEDNIVGIMQYDTILQKVAHNMDGIGLLLEEAGRPGEPVDFETANRFVALKVELIQTKGMTNGLIQLGDNISHAIDSINNYRLNQVMRTLTILTVCIAIPTLIAGIYGMNVPLPFQEKEWLLALITASCLVVVVLVMLVFKRRKYF